MANGLKGLEKESLRTTPDGKISQAPHPITLGSALTHPYITTDYSEALMEFITPPYSDSRGAIAFLRDIHQFVYDNLADELLLATSMPCAIHGDNSIPIAYYGTSNIGRMKQVYRRGLGHRYGRAMQAISGVHFNYSIPETFWPMYQVHEKHSGEIGDFIADCYFSIIRNFLRCGWLVLYLFGASPAICRSFLHDRHGLLDEFEYLDDYSLYKPCATSLRMSDIGYKNSSQSELNVSYNSIDQYIASLTTAIETPHPQYSRIGIAPNGEYRQLNDSILQIENEYYSTIRPKQIANSGEKPTLALKHRGVRYIEIRSLDVNIFRDVGVDENTLNFLEALILTTLFQENRPVPASEASHINQNLLTVANDGRNPQVELIRGDRPARLRDWALEICEEMRPVCEILDGNNPGRAAYATALDSAIAAINEPALTPSSRLLAEIEKTGEPFAAHAQRVSAQYAAEFRSRHLSGKRLADFQKISRQSLEEQQELEQNNTDSFDVFLRKYFEQH